MFTTNNLEFFLHSSYLELRLMFTTNNLEFFLHNNYIIIPYFPPFCQAVFSQRSHNQNVALANGNLSVRDD
jgi:hypothetical protein